VGDIVDDRNDNGGTPTNSFVYGTNAFGEVTTGAEIGSVAAADEVQDAIDETLPGGRVNLYQGTYAEDITIDVAGLTLSKVAAASRDDVILEGVATQSNASMVPLPNINVLANNVTISQLTIRSPEVPDGEHSSGIVVDGEDVTISNNRFVSREDADNTLNTALAVAVQTWRDDDRGMGLDSNVNGLEVSNNLFEGTLAAGYVAVPSTTRAPRWATLSRYPATRSRAPCCRASRPSGPRRRLPVMPSAPRSTTARAWWQPMPTRGPRQM
jgi:hypothetical protein